jgi:hypothetical protein
MAKGQGPGGDMRRGGRRVSEHTRERILLLHEKGLTRGEIEKIVDVSGATITAIVKADGRSFDTSKTEVMVQKRSTDLANLRARIAFRMAEKADELISDLDKPFTAFNFGGKDNTYEEHQLERPPDGAIRNLMQSASIAVQRSMDLTKFDTDPNQGSSSFDAWLKHMTGEAEDDGRDLL